MSKNIWVSSDWHLFHSNILKFRDSKGDLIRGSKFDTVEQMNEYILEKHNSIVRPGDRFYHLGDVVLGDREEFSSLWPKFHGSKNLIVGNHDDVKFLSNGGFFRKIQMWRMFPEFGLMLSHVPLHESNLLRLKDRNGVYPDDCYKMLNVHGHIHHNKSPEGPYHNVSVEAIDYTPVNLEELRQF